MAEYKEIGAVKDAINEHLHFILDEAPISVGTKDIYEMAYRHVIDVINSVPSADVRGIVLCKDCTAHEYCVTEQLFYLAGFEEPFCCAGVMREES